MITKANKSKNKKTNKKVVSSIDKTISTIDTNPKAKISSNSDLEKANKGKSIVKSKKETTKKASKSKTTKTVKNSTKKASKKTPVKVQKSKQEVKKETVKKTNAEIVEYYDLPYRYNETIVKILYQTPDTLFVYWDISDNDRKNYVEKYGENFFNITRPVLIIHNDTMNYSFEVPINDFANSWYLHINDSKCHYRIELGRRPNYYNQEASEEIKEKVKTDYIYVSQSNNIESPNDRILFHTNDNNTIKFRNIKNNEESVISLFDIIKTLPAMKKANNIPYISEELFKILYTGIYEGEDIKSFEKHNNKFTTKNPSSGSLSSRFM